MLRNITHVSIKNVTKYFTCFNKECYQTFHMFLERMLRKISNVSIKNATTHFTCFNKECYKTFHMFQ